MFILLTLVTFLLFITVSYLWKEHYTQPRLVAAREKPEVVRELGFDVPRDYAFHPGHTWALDEGNEVARVGLDAFAANLFGTIDRIEVQPLNRWVRQGQKLWTVTSGGVISEMVSPVEGVVTSVNQKVMKNPGLAADDPYGDGWVCTVKAPELAVNKRNLLQGNWVAPWMKNSITRLAALSPSVASADGGLPVKGVLGQLDPEVQRTVIREFLLG
jgi:glycine cleavage system H lipoate-binding protein